MSNASKKKPNQTVGFQKKFYHPKYWGIWLVVGMMRLLAILPYNWKFPIGRGIGKVLYFAVPKRRRLASVNLAIAFPELSEPELKQLVKKHYGSLGTAFIEMAMAWWGSDKNDPQKGFDRARVTFIGEEYLKEAQQLGKGVIMVGPHLTTLELTGLLLSFITVYQSVYRPHNNPFMDYLIAKGRAVTLPNGEESLPISNRDTRRMLRHLKSGGSMVILPDQKYRGKGSIEVPFFDKLAPSNPAVSKISKLTGCAVVPIYSRRLENNHYQVEFLPALENFPSGDDYEDTLRLHKIYEAELRRYPEQYLWVHNRWDLKEY